MINVNEVTILGRLGKDPETKATQSGAPVASCSVATSEYYKKNPNDKDWQEKTVWHNVVAWGKLAEKLYNDGRKGDCIYVKGKINNRSYEVDGQKKYVSEVVAKVLAVFSNNSNVKNTNNTQNYYTPDGYVSEDIPF